MLQAQMWILGSSTHPDAAPAHSVKGAQHPGLVEFGLWLLRAARPWRGCTTFDVLVVDASVAASAVGLCGRIPVRESGFSLRQSAGLDAWVAGGDPG